MMEICLNVNMCPSEERLKSCGCKIIFLNFRVCKDLGKRWKGRSITTLMSQGHTTFGFCLLKIVCVKITRSDNLVTNKERDVEFSKK